MIAYHDQEWGVPVHDDRLLFEFLILEGAQAGLSWQTILNKRDAYREAFAGFDPARVARFDARRVERLLGNPGIVRNRLKIQSAVTNARAFLACSANPAASTASSGASSAASPRRTAGGQRARFQPARRESDALAAELKRRGFRFVGTTICYAFMQATGMVNDHLLTCPRYHEIARA